MIKPIAWYKYSISHVHEHVPGYSVLVRILFTLKLYGNLLKYRKITRPWFLCVGISQRTANLVFLYKEEVFFMVYG